MDIRAIRLRNLASLRRADESVTDFANRLGRSQSQLSQLLVGGKTIGDRIARDIESRTDLPGGWMDHTHDDAAQAPAGYVRLPCLLSVHLPGAQPVDGWTHLDLPETYIHRHVAPVPDGLHLFPIAPDVLLVDTRVRRFTGDGVYVLRVGDLFLVRQLQIDVSGDISMQPLRDGIVERVCATDSARMRIEGRVVRRWRLEPV